MLTPNSTPVGEELDVDLLNLLISNHAMQIQKPIHTLRKSKIAMWFRKPYRKAFCKLEDHGITSDNPLWFARKSKGVIHVGAHAGQEGWIYAIMGLPVVWFEPIPEVFRLLENSISKFSRQRAIQTLITDRDDVEYDFNVSDNQGGSSSIFEFDGHEKMYPGVGTDRVIKMRSITLDTAIDRFAISKSLDTLVLDTQGAELLVLKGGTQALARINWILAECADFSAYKMGCQCSEIGEFLLEHGFHEHRRFEKATKEGVGTYFDILYVRG